MIEVDYVRTMAGYNAWQNELVLEAAEAVGEAARRAERGAFFGSIHKTLCHLLWADQLWLHRFAGTPPPAVMDIPGSVGLCATWEELSAERRRFDGVIRQWALSLDPLWLEGELTWHSGAVGREVTRPKALLAVHLFNHQAHHRGQVHAMLTAAGARTGPSDLPFMPETF